MAAMDVINSETQKVVAVLPNFHYSMALAKDDAVEEIQGQLKGLLQHTEEVKAGIQTEMETVRQHLQEAETALEQVKDSERQGVAQLEAKVTVLVEAQMQLQEVEAEKKKVDAQHRDDLREGDELREARSKNVSINEGAFGSLLNGSWTSKEDKDEKLAMLKEYLQDIGTEKTLVAAADGLSTEPEVRGDFDKMSIDCITEELASQLKKVEEKLQERAPAERLMQAEILGLQALLEVSQQKATSAEEEHKQVEVVVKGSKTEMKTCKQQVTKYSKDLQGLTSKMEAEGTKVKTLEEASGAVERLVEAAKAAVEEQAAAAEAAAEMSEVEKVAASTAEDIKAWEDLLPPTKRQRTEDETKEAKVEAQVASPARVRVSIG